MNEQRLAELWLEIEDLARRDPASGEQWRDIPGWEGLYQASNLGQIRSLDRTVSTSRSQRRYKGCVLQPTLNEKGYSQVDLCNSPRRKTKKVHTLVMWAWVGPLPEGLEICHGKNGLVDNSIGNLSYDTPSENGLHRRRDSTDNGRAVIRSDGVIFPSITVAAEEMGCNPSSQHIGDVCRNRPYCKTAMNFGWEFIEPDKLKHHRKGRPVRRSDGKYFKSIAEAARITASTASAIWAVCQGKRKTHHGYGWEYIKEELEERNTDAKLSICHSSN